MQSAMDELASGVLNNAGAICQTYRMLNVPKLLTAIGRSELNVLAIGRGQSWIINARTPDTHHFIGTESIMATIQRSAIEKTGKDFRSRSGDTSLKMQWTRYSSCPVQM